MTQTLPYLDDIAIKKNRDVVFVLFYKNPFDFLFSDLHRNTDPLDDPFENHKERNKLIQFLNENNISYKECFGPYTPGYIIQPYTGTLYIDVVFDETNSNYQLVKQYLENDDDTSKIENVLFCYFLLSDTTKDEDREYNQPGYFP